MINASMYGIKNKLDLPAGTDLNLYKADAETLSKLKALPRDLQSACKAAADSSFIKSSLPEAIIDSYCNR